MRLFFGTDQWKKDSLHNVKVKTDSKLITNIKYEIVVYISILPLQVSI